MKRHQPLKVSDPSPSGGRLVVVALCAMTCAVPLVYPPPGVYGYGHMLKLLVLHLCIALASLGWLWQTRWGRDPRLTSGPLLLSALCLMGVVLLSAPGAPHPLGTLAELLDQAALIVLLFIAAQALPLQRTGPILWTSATTGLGVALIGILQYHNLAFVNIPTNGPPSATFGYRNYAAMYLICAMPL